MTKHQKATSSSAPAAWSLGGDAPEPQRIEDPKAPTASSSSKINTAATHTGTDPLGRAVGPAENHKEIKKVRDPKTGKVVTPKSDGTLPGDDAKAQR